MLAALDAWQLLETAHGEGIGTPIVVVSARGTETDRVSALEREAEEWLVKPFPIKELVARVARPHAAALAPGPPTAACRSSSRSF